MCLFDQGKKTGQVLGVPLVNLAGGLVGGGGFGADESVGAAATFGDVCQIAAVAVDRLVQMLPTKLGQRKPDFLFVRVGKKSAQRSAIGALAGQFVLTAEVGGRLRRGGGTVG